MWCPSALAYEALPKSCFGCRRLCLLLAICPRRDLAPYCTCWYCPIVLVWRPSYLPIHIWPLFGTNLEGDSRRHLRWGCCLAKWTPSCVNCQTIHSSTMASSSQTSVLSRTKIVSYVAIRWGWCDFFVVKLAWAFSTHIQHTLPNL